MWRRCHFSMQRRVTPPPLGAAAAVRGRCSDYRYRLRRSRITKASRVAVDLNSNSRIRAGDTIMTSLSSEKLVRAVVSVLTAVTSASATFLPPRPIPLDGPH
eukprot:TRINITY_DN25353_c0_g1_i1.p2 TRINITY_DN25353_c0_g1~~TRINITY_DN25353_c0_g1_i1.p2  ORF type:complete len:102 (-),score=16.89 TRINITY_DN25353_c0_g1_i1:57-362(-)